MFKVNKKILERGYSGIFLVNFEQVNHIAVVYLFCTLHISLLARDDVITKVLKNLSKVQIFLKYDWLSKETWELK